MAWRIVDCIGIVLFVTIYHLSNESEDKIIRIVTSLGIIFGMLALIKELVGG